MNPEFSNCSKKECNITDLPITKQPSGPLDLREIDAIIFDLGGVILNLDFDGPKRAFEALGVTDFEAHFTQMKQSRVFLDLEVGAIGPPEFRNQLREELGIDLPDEALDNAWDSILLDFPAPRIRLLEELKAKYRTFLLCNTNILHYDKYSADLYRDFGYRNMGELLEKDYYSHELGLRKPDSAIYEAVIKDAGLEPGRSLFIDDLEENIVAARHVGLKAHFLNLKAGEDIVNLLTH